MKSRWGVGIWGSDLSGHTRQLPTKEWRTLQIRMWGLGGWGLWKTWRMNHASEHGGYCFWSAIRRVWLILIPKVTRKLGEYNLSVLCIAVHSVSHTCNYDIMAPISSTPVVFASWGTSSPLSVYMLCGSAPPKLHLTHVLYKAYMSESTFVELNYLKIALQ